MKTPYFAVVVVAAWLHAGSICSPLRAAVPEEWRDDADLVAVAVIDDPQAGKAAAWACGDRGAVWHSADSGATWRRQTSGVDCKLYGVHFLDAQNGWLVGGGYEPYTHRSRGVVLRTADGGATWTPETTALVPLLRKIRMVTPREGWAVGEASEVSPAGVYVTRDGGKTWSGAGGRLPAGVVAADLGTTLQGICADGRGRIVRVDHRTVDATPAAEFGLRTVHDLLMPDDGPSWLVGDGGLVRASVDGGRSWLVPGQDFAEGSGLQCDWHAVAARGARLWIVGAPGSVVLHTSDNGATWTLLPTGQTLPLYDVAFLDERRGLAVGAMGVILSTNDGGLSWRRVSREPRRAALWSGFADAESLPAEIIAHTAAEDGFRTVVTLLGRRDAEPGCDDAAPNVERRLAAASALGAASAEQCWALPLRQSALQPPAEAMLTAWGDGDADAGLRFAQARLVRTLRMWRPEVVLTHAPSPRGTAPATHFLHQLILEAVEAAGDPAKFPEQIELLGLQSWLPRKVFGYDAEGMTGSVSLDREQVMFRTAQALDDFCERYRGLTYANRRPSVESTACRLVWNRTASGSAPRELFAGLDIAIGGDARRPSAGDNGELRVRMRRAAERRRHMEAVVLQRSGIVGAGLIDQVRTVVGGLEPEPAGDVVFQLAEAFRFRGRWEAARETYEFLATSASQHPATDAALRRAIQYLASAEADHRLRRTMEDLGPAAGAGGVSLVEPPHTLEAPSVAAAASVGTIREPRSVTLGQQMTQPTPQLAPQSAAFDRLHITMAPSSPVLPTAPIIATPAARLLGAEPSASTLQNSTLPNLATNAPTPTSKVLEATLVGATAPADRRRRALGLGQQLSNRDPAAHAVPETAFPLAAARRLLGQTAEAEAFYQHFAAAQADGPWQLVALDELALARRTPPQRRMYTAAQATERPLLDGKLDDAVWRSAEPLALRSQLGDDAAWPTAVWIAADADHLYVAIRAKRTGPAPALGSEVRQRDADLRTFDRVELLLDVDRDYATHYKLAIDCRGWTHESCWGDATWDPKWFVAAGGDDEHWVAEAAIPWRELVAQKPTAGEVWAVGLQRISPLVGFQCWTTPAAAEARPEGFGYLTLP